eukprot:444482-Pelagomonas_calceolata.AAC.1
MYQCAIFLVHDLSTSVRAEPPSLLIMNSHILSNVYMNLPAPGKEKITTSAAYQWQTLATGRQRQNC